MNRVDLVINVIISAVSIFGEWWLVFWLLRDYLVDSFREQIFALRAELFDEAETGEIFTFDHPAYGLLRGTMNGFIRFGHRLSLTQVLIMTVFLRPHNAIESQSFPKKWNEAIKNMDSKATKRLQGFLRDMNILVVRHAFINSPLLVLLILPPILFLFMAKFFVDQIVQMLQPQLDQLNSVAMVEGK